MLREADSGYVLRSTTTSDLGEFLTGPKPVETAWLSPARQFEEAWFLGLRLNRGVDVNAVEREFGADPVALAMSVVGALVEDGLLESDRLTVRLTPRGRMLSNEVFQEFLGLDLNEGEKASSQRPVARAAGAVMVSPALQRGVGKTSNSSRVP
jgi:oxygen-independent coproporphyrinogen-3 oxidase